MPRPLLRMSFPDRAALEQEHAANLKHGRAFIKDADGVAALDDVTLELLLEAPCETLAIDAQAVLVCDSGPMRGIGVQLRPFNPEVLARLEAFVSGAQPAAAAAEPAPEAPAQPSAADPEPNGAQAEASEAAADEGAAAAAAGDAAEPGADAAEAGEASEAADDEGDELPEDRQQQTVRHERLRKLSLAQQQKVARTGDLHDRVTLERLFGKQVWESLLHNAKVTVPEVARIARKGTIPRPLLEFIVENNAWIQAAIVRRALLGNPRVSSEAIMKLLRMTPKHELKAIYKTTTYSSQVREAARKVLEL